MYLKDYPEAGKRHQIYSDVYTHTPSWDTKTKTKQLVEIRNTVKATAQAMFDNWKGVFDLELDDFAGFKDEVTVT